MKTIQKKSAMLSYPVKGIMLLALFILGLTSCKKDDDQGPDTSAQLIGAYAVKDVSASSGYTYNYDITIASGADGNLQISNFADVLKVPVKATINGTTLTIAEQTFNGSGGSTMKVSGSGTLAGNVINFTYKTTGAMVYNGTCTATKK